MNEVLKQLKIWVKKPGNSYARAAVALGYKDCAPIRQWIARKSIPSYQMERVQRMLKGELK